MKTLTLLIKPAAGLCNLNCRYCFYRPAGETHQNSIMTAETADTLIQKIAEYHPSTLSVVFQGGEPTLAGLDFFRSFVKKVKKNLSCSVSYALQTNGILIDDEFAEFFKENGFLVGVSLDGDRETNDRCRLDKSGKSVFDRVLKATEILRNRGVDFNILSVVDDLNAGDIGETMDFFKNRGFDFIQFIPCIGDEGGVSLSPESYETFLKKSFDLWYNDYINGKYISIRHIDNYIGVLLGYPPENCAMCGVCGSYFVIEADGSIYPCDFYCLPDYRLASVYDKNPFDIGEKHSRFIEQSYLIHEKCRPCPYYPLCRGGCRRDRINHLTENRYCSAYKAFFAYAGERLREIAESLG